MTFSPDDEQQAKREIAKLEGTVTPAQFDQLEGELRLRAGALGWTGDPLRQPATTVLAAIRTVKRQPTP
ncbi:MAG: hypothetical protein M3Y72_25310 [Acidobacteriota bacterium]|nr:hypothetical protein [Acidobacteriota bacterium]